MQLAGGEMHFLGDMLCSGAECVWGCFGCQGTRCSSGPGSLDFSMSPVWPTLIVTLRYRFKAHHLEATRENPILGKPVRSGLAVQSSDRAI